MKNLKLGKLPAAPRPTDLKLATYAKKSALPKPTAVFGYGKLYADWGMLGNGPDPTVEKGFQGAGDCVFAGAAHETMVWRKLRHGVDTPMSGKTTIEDYSELTGYVLDDPSTDYGTDMHDAAGYRKRIGIRDANEDRHRIAAYLFLRAGDFSQAVTAAYTFGAVGVGFEFPNSAWDQFDAGEPWDDVGDDQIDGGHYVPGVGSMDSSGQLTCLTWGKRQVMTKAFYEKYVDEAVVYLSEEQIRGDGEGIHGLNLTELKADLAAL